MAVDVAMALTVRVAEARVPGAFLAIDLCGCCGICSLLRQMQRLQRSICYMGLCAYHSMGLR